jgi:hypothetical protein
MKSRRSFLLEVVLVVFGGIMSAGGYCAKCLGRLLKEKNAENPEAEHKYLLMRHPAKTLHV